MPDPTDVAVVSSFEVAVDAIVSGDIVKLKNLLQADPDLVRERSPREHHSTLLHYVAANGVEDVRQKTPANIVEITKLLLDSGAEVDAESDAYGGRCTTLGLAATSAHPERAGVQSELIDVLLERGAVMDYPGSIVNACLGNGRGRAAEHLAQRGARLDLEGAAGIGRLDLVKSFFANDGSLRASATQKQMTDGFAWACEFGRTNVVDFLLQKGIEINTRLRHNRQTGLHWAALCGHAETAKLLLDRGASIDLKDESYNGTPLEWALYGWAGAKVGADTYYNVVALLARAGSRLAPGWDEGDPGRRRAQEKIQSDPRMQAALDQGR
jgi:ankyrin repeat protein